MDPYYSRPEVSNSDLSEVKKLFYPSFLNNDPYDAFRIGTLIDAFVTEPEKIDYYALRIGDYKYTQAEFDHAARCREAVLKDSFCADFFLKCEFQNVSSREMEMEYQGVTFSLPTRCKWDFKHLVVKWGGDLKSTDATSQKAFEAAIDIFDWDRSRAWYMDVAETDKDIIIGVSKINFKIFKIPITRESEIYKKGREKYLELAFKYWTLFHNF
jgi:hypothetical protein